MAKQINWDKVKKRNSLKPRRKDWELERLIGSRGEKPIKKSRKQNKKDMDGELKKHGWQVCPVCKKGRHPNFSLCRKCRINKIPSY